MTEHALRKRAAFCNWLLPLTAMLWNKSLIAQSFIKAAVQEQTIHFPADAGIINVKTEFGAKGDGLNDDTNAIRRAIDAAGPELHVLYFPRGTYVVSDTISWQRGDKAWRSALEFVGESERNTVIKLKDGAEGYQDPRQPRPIIRTGSFEPWNKTDGSGYNGFSNYIFNLTIDSGSNNVGAVGIDYLGNNICGLENVTIKTSDAHHRGAIGLAMTRKYVGPCYYHHLTISGFDLGIVTGETEYSHTFDDLVLSDQRVAGFENSSNVVSIRGLTSSNIVPVLRNKTALGLVVLVDAHLQSSEKAKVAIENNGAMFLRQVKVRNYLVTLMDAAGKSLSGTINEYSSPSTELRHIPNSLNLEIENAPQDPNPDDSEWINVVSVGADPAGQRDSTEAIQKAMDSEAKVVYFPIGKYKVTDTIQIRGGTKRILGPAAMLVPAGGKFSDAQHPMPVLRFMSLTSDLTIDDMYFGHWMLKSYAGAIMIENASPHALTLRHIYIAGVYHAAYETGRGGFGRVFIEDVAGGPWLFRGPQKVWARQLDIESPGDKVMLDGAQLWLMGIKTERQGTVVHAQNGAFLELLGGLLYPAPGVNDSVPVDEPAFVVDNSNVSLSYAIESFGSEKGYSVQVSEINKTGNSTFMACRPRGYGCLLPFYRTEQRIH